MSEPKVDMEQLLDYVLNDKPISIARMREWLKHLVGENAALRREIERHNESRKYAAKVALENDRLRASNAVLVDILTRLDQFFDFSVYLEFGDGNDVDDPAFINKVFDDAREFLKQIGGHGDGR